VRIVFKSIRDKRVVLNRKLDGNSVEVQQTLCVIELVPTLNLSAEQVFVVKSRVRVGVNVFEVEQHERAKRSGEDEDISAA